MKMQVKYRDFLFHRFILFFPLKFVGTVFIPSKISSHVITESSIIFAKYLSFPQLHEEGFQI